MQIFVKTLTGKTIVLDVSVLNTIENVKQQIYEKTNIPTKYQRLIYSNINFKNEQTLEYYKIEKESTLHLALRLGEII